ncbi:MAG: MBL fold metallo-hydrolase [Betaproteobacteria bacterium]|nr:MBL fold metallo-hydrolase [Betaproteobacteria bacterium]
MIRINASEQSGRTRVPASLQGELQPTIYRFKLGLFEVATILDGKSIREGLHPNFGGNASADAVHALARANNIDTNRYEHPYIPTLVNTGRELVLFDTGNGALSREYEQLSKRLPPGQLVAHMRKAGYKPEDVDVVVSTHGHPDHIGGLTEGGRLVFPNARYVFGAAEFDFWKRGENVREARKFNRELFVKICGPLAERSTFVKPGDEVVPGIHAVDAAGHSPGLLAFHIESAGKRLMITADTCTQYVMAVQRPEWYFEMDDDKDKAVASRQRILDMVATERVFVASFHFPFPGIGWVEKSPASYRWVPVSYQMNL